MQRSSTERIVVGVDGSEQSHLALRWAAAEARLRRALLEVVIVWSPPHYGIDAMNVSNSLEDAARDILNNAITEVAVREPTINVTSQVAQGAVAPILIDLSKGAAMLVVGSRGHGGVSRLLLGSVSQQCSSHAHCPVVIVR